MTRKEFLARMRGFPQPERGIVEERLSTNYRRDEYAFLTPHEAEVLGAMLDRLLPQDFEEKIDLVGFMDWAIPKPLGYGHRVEGTPDSARLFRDGLAGVEETVDGIYPGRHFTELADEEKDEVLRAVEQGASSAHFFQELMQKAVAGYCAHPRVWMRIGFYGPAYPEGYVWVSRREVEARYAENPGHLYF
ncbi:MAG: gluconate 2-dehydrogenase subunit 3 family protein [Armatimonadota bacterium]